MSETKTIQHLEELLYDLDTCIRSAENLGPISAVTIKDLKELHAQLVIQTNNYKSSLSRKVYYTSDEDFLELMASRKARDWQPMEMTND